jgi:MFS family permease
VGVTGAAGIAIAGPRMPAGYAACAAILIAGAVVFILWAPDEPLPSAFRVVPGGLMLETMSDRSGHRKPRVIKSSVVMAIAAPARLTEVLPAAADRAKDLGLINIAYNLPLVVGSLLAGVVLGLMNSYLALLAVAGVVTLTAVATVTRVRLTA